MWLQFQGHAFARPWEPRFAAELVGVRSWLQGRSRTATCNEAGKAFPHGERTKRRAGGQGRPCELQMAPPTYLRLLRHADQAQPSPLLHKHEPLPHTVTGGSGTSTAVTPEPTAPSSLTEWPAEPLTCRRRLRAGQQSAARALLPAWGTGTKVTRYFYLSQWECPPNCLPEAVKMAGPHSWGFSSRNWPAWLFFCVVSLWHQQKPGLETLGRAEYLHKFTHLAFLRHSTSFWFLFCHIGQQNLYVKPH